MADNIEKREVGDKTKGFRLQKLRATQLALNEIKQNREAHIYFSVELFGDVYLYSESNGEISETSEEDKNYDPEKAFTFNNHEIKNTIVIFLTVWKEKRFSSKLRFSFYTSAKIGKEKRVGDLKEKEIPEDGILKNISSKNYSDGDTIELAKLIVLEEMKSQKQDELYTFYSNYDDEEWKSFFDLIIWNFEEDDEEVLEEKLITNIKESPLYTIKAHNGLEKFILKHILDDLDAKQSRKDYLERIFTTTDLQLIFLKAERGILKGCDPSHEIFEEIIVTDKRNLKEKISIICTSYPSKKQAVNARKIVISKAEQNKLKGDKTLLSQLCRIYDKSDDFLDKNPIKKESNPDEIEAIFDQLTDQSYENLSELSKSYKYPLLNKESIKSMVLDLFDRCYLSFDDNFIINGNENVE